MVQPDAKPDHRWIVMKLFADPSPRGNVIAGMA
jgi:hypothetical protein